MLPFRDGSFSGAAALWVLYHLASPLRALAELRRCLRPGGLAVVAAPSRYNDPELSPVLLRWGQPLSFDAENGPMQVASVFTDVEVETWDEPMVSLSAQQTLRFISAGGGCPRARPAPRRPASRPL